MMRVARAVAQMSQYSRRASEQLVAQGRVTVNGAPVTHPAVAVDPDRDQIAVDGRVLTRPPRCYYAVHKPPGVTSTVRDPHATRTVVELVPAETRLYPVGRLDRDSEGLILLTNDGDFAHRVSHPRRQVEKEYRALVTPTPAPQQLAQLRAGIELAGRLARPIRVAGERDPEGSWVRVVLHEGRKREVRRLLAAVGLSVRRLVRTRIGPVRLGALPPGAYRPLSLAEIGQLSQDSARRARSGPGACGS